MLNEKDIFNTYDWQKACTQKFHIKKKNQKQVEEPFLNTKKQTNQKTKMKANQMNGQKAYAEISQRRKTNMKKQFNLITNKGNANYFTPV